jgi:regulator of Ty1 transposition protein 109
MTSTSNFFGARREPKSANPNPLVEKLKLLLPKGYEFGIYHLSTPPTRTEALYSAPQGERPDKTYREDHFLAISINARSGHTGETAGAKEPGTEQRRVLVLALEVFLFTTAFSTTLFVSKADSTGYLHLLRLPKGSPSPVREISAAFVSFLVETRQRKGIQTVVSLFARAQSQYLFPGSVDNEGKHVLDDRGLVKWWCRVLNPLLEAEDGGTRLDRRRRWGDIKAYLVVPGLDRYETRAFLPRTPNATENWTLGHPLERISRYAKEYDHVPLRCLIPLFPDDPKARFRDELEVEASKSEQDTGVWKSVKTLDQFWEMMAYRQECSSGRLTGFIWVVFDPKESSDSATVGADLIPTSSNGAPATPPRRRAGVSASPMKKGLPAPADSTPPTKGGARTGKDENKEKKRKKRLKGAIIPREPKIKTHQRNYLLDRPTSTAYYYWPPEGRGERIVDEANYKRIVELLLHLDFETLDKACGSTSRWISEVGVGTKWGTEVVGTRDVRVADSTVGDGKPAATVNNLAGLIKRKRTDNGPGEAAATSNGTQATAPVNVLGAGLVRKKKKEDAPGAQTTDTTSATTEAPVANVLGAGLIRKKPKAT